MILILRRNALLRQDISKDEKEKKNNNNKNKEKKQAYI